MTNQTNKGQIPILTMRNNCLQLKLLIHNKSGWIWILHLKQFWVRVAWRASKANKKNRAKMLRMLDNNIVKIITRKIISRNLTMHHQLITSCLKQEIITERYIPYIWDIHCISQIFRIKYCGNNQHTWCYVVVGHAATWLVLWIRNSHPEVRNTLCNLDVTKACGLDGIQAIVLRTCAPELSPLLTCLLRFSLESSQVAGLWKLANLQPVLIKGSRADPVNYRPISLTFIPAYLEVNDTHYCFH